MPDVKYTLPDGQEYIYKDVPASVKPDEIIARVRAEHGGQMPTMVERSSGNEGWDLTKERLRNFFPDLGRGALKAGEFLLEGAEGFNSADRPGKSKAPPTKSIADTLIEPRVATSPADATFRAMTEGLGGSVLSPGAMIARPALTAATGVLSGLGSYMGEQALGPVGGLAGGLAGGLGPQLLHNLMPAKNAPALAATALRGIPEANLDEAARRQVEMQSRLPVGVNVSQAMRAPSNLDDLVAALAASKEGTAVQSQLQEQPRQLNILAKSAEALLPGQRLAPQTIADRAQKAATGRIKDLETERTDLTSELFEKAPPMSPRAPQTLANIVNEARFAKGVGPEVAALMKTLEDRLSLSPRTGAPTVDPQDAAAYIRAFKAHIDDNPLIKGDRMGQGQMKALAQKLNEAIGNASPATALGNRVYSEFTRDVIAPEKKGIVGQIAGVTGSQEDRAAKANRLLTAFEQGTPDPRASDITKAELALRKSDPTLFQDAGRTWLGQKLETALKTEEGGRVPEGAAKSLKDAFGIGQPSKEQGLRDVLAGMARDAGQPEAPVVNGFMRFLEAADVASRRPARVSSLPNEAIEEVAGKSIAGSILTSATPGRVGGKVFSKYSSGAKSAVDKLLTTPEGFAQLRELAKLDPASRRAQLLIASILGGRAAAGEE